MAVVDTTRMADYGMKSFIDIVVNIKMSIMINSYEVMPSSMLLEQTNSGDAALI